MMGAILCSQNAEYKVPIDEPFVAPNIVINMETDINSIDRYLTREANRKIIAIESEYFDSALFIVNYIVERNYTYLNSMYDTSNNKYRFILKKNNT